MGDRSRIRVGRGVLYNPTTAEITAQGAGPWAAQIVKVNSTGTVDLLVFPPSVASAADAALADPLIAAPALAAFTDPPSAAEMALLRTLVNELRTDVNVIAPLVNDVRAETVGLRKTAVSLGSTGGTFSLEGDSSAV